MKTNILSIQFIISNSNISLYIVTKGNGNYFSVILCKSLELSRFGTFFNIALYDPHLYFSKFIIF